MLWVNGRLRKLQVHQVKQVVGLDPRIDQVALDAAAELQGKHAAGVAQPRGQPYARGVDEVNAVALGAYLDALARAAGDAGLGAGPGNLGPMAAAQRVDQRGLADVGHAGDEYLEAQRGSEASAGVAAALMVPLNAVGHVICGALVAAVQHQEALIELGMPARKAV